MEHNEITAGAMVTAKTKKGNVINATIVGLVDNSFTMVKLIEVGESKPKSFRSENGASWSAGTFLAGDEYIIHRKEITKK